MKMLIFSIKDRATDAFGTPVFMLTTGQAQRSFSDEVNRKAPDNPYSMHPGDYDLYAIGEFFSDNATFNTHEPRLVVRGQDLVQSPKEVH